MYIGEDIIICRDGEEEAAMNAWSKEREMSVKKLFEETITIPIEKYDDLLKKAGRLEHIMEAVPSLFAPPKENQDANVFEVEDIEE